ncbi:MAG TPA: sigma-70 family RNA polymerase sigma factor [Patescibacteria group bacterium]|jgi:RNA polymerase sigma-70 factor (ECF subfamily)|nr:sigma-70 family RNA polymerase sigma factor [Patescibacteria group bacterium]
MEELTDEAITRQVQQGDTHAFGVLVERYQDKLQRYAKRFLFGHEDSQDIVQDVFLKAYSNLQSFDPTLKFSPWIYRIAHNEFINAIRKKGREPLSFFDPDTLFPHPIAKERADTEVKDNELRAMLDSCLEKLDLKYREPLVLYYYEDMDYQSISEILHVPVSTVGVRLSRGKTALQKVYTDLHPNEATN